MQRILFVDDEPKILMGLRRSLHAMRRDWQMEFADGGAAALVQCASAPFDIVVSDARMPGMEGFELLNEVMRLYPDTVRIVLSGQCSRNSVIKCAGVAHQFLSKPCDPETICAALRRVCDVRRRFDDRSLRQSFAGVEWLPVQSKVRRQLAAAIQEPETSPARLAAIIAGDVALSAKVIQFVSSGFFGTPQRVTCPAEAARLLGLDAIKGLLAASDLLATDPGGDGSGDLESLTAHSLAVARAAKAIAETMTDRWAVLGDAYLAGMLHEIGALVRSRRPGSPLAGNNRPAAGDGADAWKDFEAGLDGQELDPAGYLLALWGLPEPVVQAVAYRRFPSRCPEQSFGPLTALHVADWLLGPGDMGCGCRSTGLDMAYLDRIGCRDRLAVWRDLCAAPLPEGVLS